MLRNILSISSVLTACVVTAQSYSNPPNGSLELFKSSLSALAEIYYPGSEEFTNATTRWGAGQTPHYDMIVKVATEEDVQETVR
jgi:hypothetical protein